MKKSIVIAAVLISAVSIKASAQVTFAPEVGIHLMPTNKVGFKAGASADIPVVGGLHFQPGIFFSQKGTKKDAFGPGMNGDYTEIKSNLTFNTIEVPLNLVYDFNFRNKSALFVFAGPYVGLGVNGKETGSLTINDKLISSTDNKKIFGSADNQYKRFDYGINMGMGYKFSSGLFFKAQYSAGLADLTNAKSTSLKNSSLGFSIGYFFGK